MDDISQKLYLTFPAFRNIAATLKGLKINGERYGEYYRDELLAIRDRDGWTSQQFAEYQCRRLRAIVELAVDHVPYYREMFHKQGLRADDIQTPRDLQKLPILEKTTVRADPLKFVDERLNAQNLFETTTTGTTGTPIRVLMSRRAQQRHYAFLETRSRRVAGFRYGQDPYVMFGSRHVVSLKRTKPPFWCYNHASKQLYMSCFHLASEFLASYCGELKRRPYKALMGYPSVMATIAQFVLERNINDLRIPIAITNGETLQQHQRKVIEQAFHCELFDQYGCAELSVFAAEQKCHRMHVSVDYGITEIVDDSGRPTVPGESGHLVCTGLVNDAQILLRCRVGDMGSWSNDLRSHDWGSDELSNNDRCECGSVLPVLQSLDGRSSNAIILPDRRAVYRVGTVAEEIASVREYQIVQEEIGKFTVYVVASAGFTDSDSEELIHNLTQHVGPAKVRVELVNRLQREPGGKFAFIVSRVPGSPNGIGQSPG